MSDTITVPARSINSITAEIVALSNQAAQNAWFSMVEIGKRLVEAKGLVDHGEWGSYLKNEVNFSQRTANNFMRIYQEHAKNPNSQAFANLSYSHVVRLLAIPEDDREEIMSQHDVSELSSRELDKVIKERDAAKADLETSDARVRELELKLLDAEQRAASAKSSESAWQAEIDKLNAAVAAAKEETTKAKNRAQYLQDHPTLSPKEKNKLVSDARAQGAKDAEQKLQSQLDAARKEAQAATEAKAAAERAVQDAQAQLSAIKKQSQFSSPDTAAFKVLFDQLQSDFNKLNGHLLKIKAADAEQGEKFRSALQTLVEMMRKQVT